MYSFVKSEKFRRIVGLFLGFDVACPPVLLYVLSFYLEIG